MSFGNTIFLENAIDGDVHKQLTKNLHYICIKIYMRLWAFKLVLTLKLFLTFTLKLALSLALTLTLIWNKTLISTRTFTSK